MKLFKKVARIILIVLAVITSILFLFVVVSVAPIDRTPVEELPLYPAMMARLDSLNQEPVINPSGSFSVGFSKVNMTPSFKTATAGYGKRRGKMFTSVHDSIFVRTLVITNGQKKVAIVSADLLIIPPIVTEALSVQLKSIGFTLENTYLGATHTHNSLGNWGGGATRFIYGSYQDTVVNLIVGSILKSIRNANQNLMPSRLKYGSVAVPDAVENRLIPGGPEDPLLRMVEITREDSSKLLLANYTAHATCLYSGDLELSRDYPGRFVDLLEEHGYDFAMFMAGSVGSHGCNAPDMGWKCIDWMAATLATEVIKAQSSFNVMAHPVLIMKSIQIPLADPQVKITQELKVRGWLFRSAFGEYPASLTVLRVGDLLMLGTPCDYSGEFNGSIDSLAAAYNLNVMVTSFNGGYIGYVTPTKYYDVNHYETQLMNWYPPGNGEYITKSLQKLMVSVTSE